MKRTLSLAAVALFAAAGVFAQPVSQRDQMKAQLKKLEAEHKAAVAELEKKREAERTEARAAIEKAQQDLNDMRAHLREHMDAWDIQLHGLRNDYWKARDALLDQLDPNGAAKRHQKDDAIKALDLKQKQENDKFAEEEKAAFDQVHAEWKQKAKELHERHKQERDALK